MADTMTRPQSGLARPQQAPAATLPHQPPTAEAKRHSEGVVARTIEEHTAKLPSDLFLWAALGSMGVSLALQFAGKRDQSLFVGQWAAPFLILGLYNKVVKVAGSDRVHAQPAAA